MKLENKVMDIYDKGLNEGYDRGHESGYKKGWDDCITSYIKLIKKIELKNTEEPKKYR